MQELQELQAGREEETGTDKATSAAEPVVATIGPQTRTSIGPKEEGTYKVHWSEGDQILISTGRKSSDKYYYTAGTYGSASALFYPEDDGQVASFASGAIASYPVDNMFLSGPDWSSDIFFTIPTIQEYVPGSFAEKAMPMVSEVTYEPVLNFHNAAGVLRLNISSEEAGLKVSDIAISTSEYICGECGYIPSSKTIFFDDTTISSNEVIIKCTEGVEITSEGTPFHVVVPHQIYSDMTIIVTTTDKMQQTFKMKSGKKITVKRSTITEIPLTLNTLNNAGEQEIKVSVTSVKHNDISIKLGMNNISSYFCGLHTKDNFNTEMASGHLLEVLDYGTPYTGPFTYSGSITRLQEELNDALIEPGQTYVIWFVPYKKTGGYTSDDIYYVEATTPGFTSGGSIAVKYSNLAIDYTSISMEISAAGAPYIYAQLLDHEALSKFPTDQDMINFLIKPGNSSSVINTGRDVFIRKFLRPGQKMTLIALAVDGSGRYGPLLKQDFETMALPYNALSVNIHENMDKLHTSSTIEWSVSGGKASSYRYILVETDRHLWTNVLERDIAVAQEKMYLEPNIYYITHTTTASAKLTNMVTGKEYILIVAAVDEKGVSSVADSWIFTY